LSVVAGLLCAGPAQSTTLNIFNSDFEAAALGNFEVFEAGSAVFPQVLIDETTPLGWTATGSNVEARSEILAYLIARASSTTTGTPPLAPLEGMAGASNDEKSFRLVFDEFEYFYSTQLASLRGGSLSQVLSGQVFGQNDYQLDLQTHQRNDGAPQLTGATVSLFADDPSNVVAEFDINGTEVLNDFSFTVSADTA